MTAIPQSQKRNNSGEKSGFDIGSRGSSIGGISIQSVSSPRYAQQTKSFSNKIVKHSIDNSLEKSFNSSGKNYPFNWFSC
jgi:hypothetical protein